MSDRVRNPAEQRRLLAATIRGAADWRRGKADEFAGNDAARRENVRAMKALLALADFVEAMPDDDPDLGLHALRRADERAGRLALTLDGTTILSRFGLGKGAWQAGQPTEAQMRNVLPPRGWRRGPGAQRP